jgi:hypothetical protein
MTRASIGKNALHSRGWIAGSSPAMTVQVSGKGVDITVLVTRRESALRRPSDRMRLLDELGQ